MESIMQLLDEMEGYLQECNNLPFSSKVVVNMEVLYEFMADLRMKLPEEVKRSRRILDEKDKLITQAEKEADEILTRAEEEAVKLISNHEIRNKAVAEAQVLLNEAKTTANEIQDSAYEYVDQILIQTQGIMRDMYVGTGKQFNTFESYITGQLETLSKNRETIQKPE